MIADEEAYTKPYREGGGIHFSLALQDGTRQPWKIADTISNWHFAWWIFACDRPLGATDSRSTSPGHH